MGSGSSKKKRTVVVAISASNAFEDAGKIAENRKAQGDLPSTNGSDKSSKLSNIISTTENGIKVDKNANVSKNDHIKNTEKEEETAETPEELGILRIQSAFRGHQERQLLKKQIEMAKLIQRRYRRHLSETSDDGFLPNTHPAVVQQRELEDRRDQRHHRSRAWRDKEPELKRIAEYQPTVGKRTQEEFRAFQDEIIDLKWKAQMQQELCECGDGFEPPRILLIASNVQHSSKLISIRKEGILAFCYDFEKETFDSLLDMIQVNLASVKNGSKIKSLCIVTQGGPGFLYLLKKRVLTVPKLEKESEADQVRFWVTLGRLMSKLNPHQSVIHFLGCNVLGNEKGKELFRKLMELMQPSIVKLEAPLELTKEGNETIDTYFDSAKYRIWKSRRYSKTDFNFDQE